MTMETLERRMEKAYDKVQEGESRMDKFATAMARIYPQYNRGYWYGQYNKITSKRKRGGNGKQI